MKKVFALTTIFIVVTIMFSNINDENLFYISSQTKNTESETIEILNGYDIDIMVPLVMGDTIYLYANDYFYQEHNLSYEASYSNKRGSHYDSINFMSKAKEVIISPISNMYDISDFYYFDIIVKTEDTNNFIELKNDLLNKDFLQYGYNYYESNINKAAIYLLFIMFFVITFLKIIDFRINQNKYTFLKSLGVSNFNVFRKEFNISKSIFLMTFILFTIFLTYQMFFYYIGIDSVYFLLKVSLISIILYFFIEFMLSLVITYLYHKIDFYNSYKQRINNKVYIDLYITEILSIALLFVITLLIGFYWPNVEDMLEVRNEWVNIANYQKTEINNYKYIGNDDYLSNYDVDLDIKERHDVVSYFEQNYNAAYISGNTHDYNKPSSLYMNFDSFLICNKNYLQLQKFDELQNMNEEKSYVLIPASLKEYNDEYSRLVKDYYNIEEISIINYEDRKFYSYIAEANDEVGDNGYYQNPILFVPSNENDIDNLYIQPFQDFFYLDNTGEAVSNYYNEYDITEYNDTKVYSKYAEYSNYSSRVTMYLKKLVFVFLVLFIIQINTFISILNSDLYIHQKEFSILITNGIDIKYNYFKLVKKHLLMVFILAVFFTILTLVIDKRIIVFILCTTIYNMLLVIISATILILRKERKNILGSLKE